jgi:hypothetical protein
MPVTGLKRPNTGKDDDDRYDDDDDDDNNSDQFRFTLYAGINEKKSSYSHISLPWKC